jgi:hypothetical protein
MSCSIAATAHASAKQEPVRDPGACRPPSSSDACRQRGLAPKWAVHLQARRSNPRNPDSQPSCPPTPSFGDPLVAGADRTESRGSFEPGPEVPWERKRDRGSVVRRGPSGASAHGLSWRDAPSRGESRHTDTRNRLPIGERLNGCERGFGEPVWLVGMATLVRIDRAVVKPQRSS